jgi:uncharacterized protein YndB with AHSA1/START domain
MEGLGYRPYSSIVLLVNENWPISFEIVSELQATRLTIPDKCRQTRRGNQVTETAQRNNKPQHATITLEHSYAAPLERVFSEFADPVARARWSAPSNCELIYDEADFRIGGKDVFRCGPEGDPKFRGETRYLDIVPNTRVISSETVDVGGQRLAVALTTLDFTPTKDGTNLTVTIQMVSFVGPDMIRSYDSGNRNALKNLSLRLTDIRSA